MSRLKIHVKPGWNGLDGTTTHIRIGNCSRGGCTWFGPSSIREERKVVKISGGKDPFDRDRGL